MKVYRPLVAAFILQRVKITCLSPGILQNHYQELLNYQFVYIALLQESTSSLICRKSAQQGGLMPRDYYNNLIITGNTYQQQESILSHWSPRPSLQGLIHRSSTVEPSQENLLLVLAFPRWLLTLVIEFEAYSTWQYKPK